MTTWNPIQVRQEINENLSSIADMFTRLREAAISRSNSHSMPGGDAMVMLGPIADVEAFSYRKMSVEFGRISETDIESASNDLESPLMFLASWSDIVRQAQGARTDKRATIAGEIKFLRDNVDWMLSTDGRGGAVFLEVDDFATRLGQVVKRMEDVLFEGDRDDVGAPCIHCEPHPRLVRVWAAPVIEERGTSRPSTEYDDDWKCPNPACGMKYSHASYLNAVKMQHRARAKWLTATDMTAEYDIAPGSLTGWAASVDPHTDKPIVRKKRDINTGRMIYNVFDALTKAGKLSVVDGSVGA